MATTINLTTTFTPPSECLTDTYRYDANQLVGPMTSWCYPQGWTNTSTAIYSPGICPSGYTTACITARTANTITETVATCCPTGFECAATNYFLGCHSTIIGGKSQLITVMKKDDYSLVSTTRIETIGGYMNAYGVHIRFQATDLGRVTATTSTAITTSSSAFSTTPLSPALANTPSPSPSPALSTGAEAGIGVGAAVAVCVGLVLLWLGWRRAKKRHAGIGDSGPGEIDGVKSTPIEAEYHGVHEMQGHEPFEAPGDNPQRELEGHHVAHRQELEGSGR